ncbi:hypothetical protein OSB04_011682 [Centaurea solstitialis]|uniref:CCHC-type domain-containing protein n=1 Tax=Centaurea solstitialis TaxID=347529 RepID=A0AA38T9W8_9ASTR|nr:hypothetical protein OSB04_011682 [Centaurea solstitialis]
MASTVTSTNNLSLRSILEKDKLTGSNFLDWERNLMIVLRHERKWYVLEEPLGEAPPVNAPAAARNAHKKHSDDLLDVACLMLATMSPDLQAGLINTNAYDMIRQLRDMFQTQARTERYDATKAFNECKMVKGTSVSDHVMKMKRHLDHLERLGHPVPLQLATDTILNSLSEDYRTFVVNYNMNNMEKTIAELHSMLKTAELNMGNKNKTKDVLMVKDGGVKKKNGHASTSKGKGPVQAIQSAPKKGKGKGKGKKVKPNKARTENRCFICNEIGHWRQNCPKRHEAGRNHSSTQQLRKVAVLHIQELEVSPGSYDQLLNNSYKCCRLRVAQIFDRVANIGRDPRLRLLLGNSHNSARGTFVGRSPVDYHQAIQVTDDEDVRAFLQFAKQSSKAPILYVDAFIVGGGDGSGSSNAINEEPMYSPQVYTESQIQQSYDSSYPKVVPETQHHQQEGQEEEDEEEYERKKFAGCAEDESHVYTGLTDIDLSDEEKDEENEEGVEPFKLREGVNDYFGMPPLLRNQDFLVQNTEVVPYRRSQIKDGQVFDTKEQMILAVGQKFL